MRQAGADDLLFGGENAGDEAVQKGLPPRVGPPVKQALGKRVVAESE